ncbi:MAG TPA: GrpB family protein [Anaerolineaceae bacterium]|nr:GrpB family protein [Anaerolineaceae bacterium]
MLTPAQEKWIAQFSDKDQITVLPFDPTAERKFAAVRRKVQAALGPTVPVEHHGATSLGISGQDEIDVYVPVPEEQFDSFLAPLTALFGPPRSYYRRERARFVTFEGSKHVNVFLINATCRAWLDGCRFEAHLRAHPEALERFRQVKAAGQGLSSRAYFRRKLEFINEILALEEGTTVLAR